MLLDGGAGVTEIVLLEKGLYEKHVIWRMRCILLARRVCTHFPWRMGIHAFCVVDVLRYIWPEIDSHTHMAYLTGRALVWHFLAKALSTPICLLLLRCVGWMGWWG